MKIGVKLTLGFLAIILLIAINSAISMDSYKKIQIVTEELKSDIVPGAIAMVEMGRQCHQIAHNTMDYIVLAEEKEEECITAGLRLLEKAGKKHLEHERHIGEKEQRTAKELLKKIEIFDSAVMEIINLKKEGVSVDELLEKEDKEIHPIEDALTKQLEEHQAVHMQELAEAEEAVYRAHIFGVRTILSMTFLEIILAAIIALLITRSIVRPVHALHRGTEIIGQGDLDYKIGTEAKDEIGQLSRAFDKMTGDLKKTTTSIDKLNREIAARKKAAEKIKQAAEEWTRTFDAISDLVFILDVNSVIIKVNKAFTEAVKLKHEDIIGKKCYEVLHKSDKAWPNCPYEMTKKDKKAHTEEIEDPNIGLPLLVSTSPIFNDKGELIGSVHIARDITGLKKAEKETKEAMKMKSEFTSVVSHELRTPLGAIKEGVAIVLDGIVGKINKEQKELLELAKRNVDRLARLINDILLFQKLDAGRVQFKMEENDINEVVRETHKTMELVAKEKGLNFIIELQKDLPRIKCDRDRIIQVLTNLVNNAIKFAEKGSIKIKTARKKDAIHIMVQDTGPGIKKEDMSKLFQSFQQLDMPRMRKVGGTGLGLAICKEIIIRHNGKIWVESEWGKGSSFHFTLPIKKERA